MMGIFRQPLVPHFGETEPALHHAKEVFDLGANLRLVAVSRSVGFAERDVSTAFLVGEISGFWCISGNGITLPCIGRISPHTAFFAVQQISQNHRIMYIGGSSYHRVNQLGFAVDTDMGLHAKEPLVALASLVHIRIALFILVLGRAWRVDDTGIDDGSPVYLQAIFLEILIDQIEQSISQVMALHQMSELTDGCFVRRRLLTEVNAHELAHRAGIVQNLFSGRVGQIEPVLQKIDTQHPLDADRTAASPLGLGIERLDGFAKLFPGDDRFHVVQELFFAGLLAKLLETVGERCLFHNQ